jgi:photosystem II stability/assembly factor-like uncharacterized protein
MVRVGIAARLLAAAPLLLAPATALSLDARAWIPVGPTGGDVRDLATDPRDPRVVYLGTADGALYRSDDAGLRWRRLLPGFPLRGMSLDNIAVDRRGRILVGYWEVDGSGGGVARSEDGGRTFDILEGIRGHSVRALDTDTTNPDVVIVGAIDGVFRSADDGSTWRRISPEGNEEIRNVESVAIDPAHEGVIYVGTWHLPWKTTDGGRTWRSVPDGMITDSDVFTMTLDQRDTRSMYATACTGIYRSRDAASRWVKISGIPSTSRRTRSFAQDPDHPEVFYAGTTEGLFVSEDDTATWRLATKTDVVVNAIAPLPRAAGGVLLLGTEGAGVLRSTDGGRTFSASNEGFAERVFARVVVDPSGLGIVVGVKGDRTHSGVLRAPRPEGPWTRVGDGIEGREVLALALDAGEVVAGTDDGLFRSVSHCGLWTRLPTVVDGIDAHPHVSDVVALPGGSILAATRDGLLRSVDDGATWERETLGLARSVLALAASTHDTRLLIATTPLGTFLSRDGGGSWEQVARGLADPGVEIHSLAFLPGSDSVVFAATHAGLLRSTDQGHVWKRCSGQLPISDIAGLAFAPDGSVVYASDYAFGGLYESRDVGETWARLPATGLTSDRVWSLAADPSAPGRLLASASTGGLHVLGVATPSTATGAP